MIQSRLKCLGLWDFELVLEASSCKAWVVITDLLYLKESSLDCFGLNCLSSRNLISQLNTYLSYDTEVFFLLIGKFSILKFPKSQSFRHDL